MTKTTKQLIEEFSERPTFKDVCYEDFAQVIEALKEAVEIMRYMPGLYHSPKRTEQDYQFFMEAFEKTMIWLKKHGFEE